MTLMNCQLHSAAILKKQFEEYVPKDFTIIHHGNKYKVYSRFASRKSYRISAILEEDSLANSVTLNIPEGPIEKIISYLNNETVQFDEGCAIFVAYAAVELVISKLLNDHKVQIMQQLTEDIALELLKKSFRNGTDFTVFADFLASRFEQWSDKIAELPVEMIDFIMKSPYYSAPDAFTKVFVLKFVNLRATPNHCLTKHLPLSILRNADGFDMSQKRYTISRMAAVCAPASSDDDYDDFGGA